MSGSLTLEFFICVLDRYDDDLGIVYLAGKGDGNIRVFQVGTGPEMLTLVGEYKSSEAQAGFSVLPKKCCDIMK
jgi:hypothetical protein